MGLGNIISPVMLNQYLELWMSEDISTFDLSCISVGPEEVSAHIEMKTKGVIAGIPFVDATFNYLDCAVEWKCVEGSMIENNTIVASVHGPLSKLLMAERTALNILGRASAVASIARRVQMKLDGNWKGEVTGSRKASPGMKMVEKYAMIVGGICTQHYDPSSIVLIKDHHVRVHGSIEESVQVVRERAGRLVTIEVECHTVKEAIEAANSGANLVLLDGLKADDIKYISKEVKEANPSVLIEVSGGIIERNMHEYAIANVDIISSSIFCQGYKAFELCLKIVPDDISSSREATAIDIVINGDTDTDVVDACKKNNTSDSAMSNPGAPDIFNVATKRKSDETSVVPEDINTKSTAIAISIKGNKKHEEKSQGITQPKAVKNVSKRGMRGRIAVTARKSESAVLYTKKLASARMAGYPIGTTAPRVLRTARATVYRDNVYRDNVYHDNTYNASDASMLDEIEARLAMTYPDRQTDNTFFRGPEPIMYGGRLSSTGSSRVVQPRPVEHPYRSLANKFPF